MRFASAAFAALLIAVSAAVAAAQPAPSFDCAKAGSAVERAICDTGELAWLDSQLARLYGWVRSGYSEEDRRVLRDEQRVWLGQRNRCGGDHACLQARYAERIAALADEAGTADVTGVYSFVDFGFGGAMTLVSYPDGQVATYIETVNEGRGHMCTLDFVGRRGADDEVTWQDLEDLLGDGTFCAVTIALLPGQARVFPENCQAYCGMAGSFEGSYRRR